MKLENILLDVVLFSGDEDFIKRHLKNNNLDRKKFSFFMV